MEILQKHRKIECPPGQETSIKILQLTDMHVWSPADGSNLKWETKGRTVRINAEGSPYTTFAEPKLIDAIVSAPIRRRAVPLAYQSCKRKQPSLSFSSNVLCLVAVLLVLIEKITSPPPSKQSPGDSSMEDREDEAPDCCLHG